MEYSNQDFKQLKDDLQQELELSVKEGFDEGDLLADIYTLVGTYDGKMGLSINNNNAANTLTVEINTVQVVVPLSTNFYDIFDNFTTVKVTGVGLDFDAYIVAP